MLKINKINKIKSLKIIIPIIIIALCGIIGGITVVIKNLTGPIHTKLINYQITKNNVENGIKNYCTTNIINGGGNGAWFFRNNEKSWGISYRANSVKLVNNQKEYLWTAIIDIKQTGSEKITKAINLHLNWWKLSDTMKSGWSQITNQIEKNDYYSHAPELNSSNTLEYIKTQFLQDHKTWYITTTATKINFTSNKVKINSDGWFTEELNPSITTDGNKNVFLVLKWLNKSDENEGDIISTIRNSGYVETAPLIENIVKKDVNDYLANKRWVLKDSKQDVYKFISTKVVLTNNFNWIVTINQDSTLKTENMGFTPFNITLDWKNQEDVISKLNEISIGIKKQNYDQEISPNTVISLVGDFLISGTWTFTYHHLKPINIQINIDKFAGKNGTGINHLDPNEYHNRVWEIFTKFDYINEKLKTSSYHISILLDWRFPPSKDKISKDILHSYNENGSGHQCKYAFKSNKKN